MGNRDCLHFLQCSQNPPFSAGTEDEAHNFQKIHSIDTRPISRHLSSFHPSGRLDTHSLGNLPVYGCNLSSPDATTGNAYGDDA